MINMSSIIDGFRVILGPLPVHLAMLIVMAICIRVPDTDQATGNDDLQTLAFKLYVQLIAIHTLAICIGVWDFYACGYNLQSQLRMAVYILQLVVVLEVCQEWIYDLTIQDEITAKDWNLLNFWFKAEILVFAGFVLTSIVYLFIRSLTTNIVDLEMANQQLNQHVDFLEAQINSIGIMQTISTFPLVSYLTIYTEVVTFTKITEDSILTITKVFMWLQIFQTFFAFFLNFVNFYQYKSTVRNEYMPYVHTVLAIATFVAIPLISVLIFIYALIFYDLWGSVYGTWLFTYSVSSVCLAPMDLLVIYPTFESMQEQYKTWMEQDAEELRQLEYRAIERQEQNQSKEADAEETEKVDELDNDENTAGLTAYRERERDYGTGDARIGTSFTFKEDMYSLLFIGQVKQMYIDACEQMQEARDKVLDEMIQQYGNNKVNAISDNQSVQIQEIVEDVDKSESAKSEKSKHSQKRQSAWKNLFNFKKKKSEKVMAKSEVLEEEPAKSRPTSQQIRRNQSVASSKTSYSSKSRRRNKFGEKQADLPQSSQRMQKRTNSEQPDSAAKEAQKLLQGENHKVNRLSQPMIAEETKDLDTEVFQEPEDDEEKEEHEYEEELDPLLQFRTNILGRVIFLFTIQCFLSILIFIYAVHPTADDEDPDRWKDFPTNVWTMLARFICGIVMHVSLSDSLDQGFKMMKYALNHPWKFDSWVVSFCAGLMQACQVVVVEIVNIVVILTNNRVLDIVMNFMALVVIADFGQFFYTAFKHDTWKKIINSETYEDMLKIQTTTSFFARHKIRENRIELQECEQESPDDQEPEDQLSTSKHSAKIGLKIPKYIKIEFTDRTWGNRVCYLFYKVLKSFYISVWFYFAPFLTIVFSYEIPYMLRE